MIILTTSTDAQSFKVIPRSAESSVTFELTDKSKRTTSLVSVSVTNSNGYMNITGSFSLVEDRFYSFAVKNGSVIIYRSSIFCTNQTNFNTFDVQSGEYTTENTYDNDFVII
jgi:predicted small secreted protein|tara:strand:- start:218 stop:553 length:336 start_codon:yes stop_codon:yes gene_type:complete